MAKREGTIRQIYAALPGLLEPSTGEVISAVNFPILNGLNLKQVLGHRSKIPCHVGSLGPAYYHGELEEQAQDRLTMLIHWDLGIGFVFGQGSRILALHSHPDGRSPWNLVRQRIRNTFVIILFVLPTLIAYSRPMLRVIPHIGEQTT